MERLVDDAGEIVRVLDQIVVLGARAGDAGGVALLEGVVADQVRRHLAGDADQRNAVHQRVGEPGDGVGHAGARGHQHDADLAGRAGVAFGRVHRAAFLADEDVEDVVLAEQRVVNGQDRAARIAEDPGDALILERLKNDLRAGHLILRHRTAFTFPEANDSPADRSAGIPTCAAGFGRAAGVET